MLKGLVLVLHCCLYLASFLETFISVLLLHMVQMDFIVKQNKTIDQREGLTDFSIRQSNNGCGLGEEWWVYAIQKNCIEGVSQRRIVRDWISNLGANICKKAVGTKLERHVPWWCFQLDPRFRQFGFILWMWLQQLRMFRICLFL